MAINGNGGKGIWSSVHNGIGLALGVTFTLGSIAWLQHHIFHGALPHEFCIGCDHCRKHGCTCHQHGAHHHGHHAMSATMNTLGPGSSGAYYLK